MTCVFIFRRDLRNIDNTGLIHAYKDYKKVIPCFIYDSRQVKNNPYISHRAIQFMSECVNDLKDSIPNFKVYKGSKAENVIDSLIKTNKNIKAVYVNKDYTDFSIKRDTKIKEICEKNSVIFKSFDDQLLIGNPENVLTNTNEPYKVFTPFYNKAKKVKFEKINPKKIGKTLKDSHRSDAISIMKSFNYKEYSKNRDYPYRQTSELSKYLKFGVISIREIYWYLKGNNKSEVFIRQLFWKDFWTYINYWYPNYKGTNIPSKWTSGSTKTKWLKAWKEGKTGFPIVDAGMRQLKETGWMHNRVRMIVASFLVKDLLINWKEGEKWFSNQLVDIDMAVNRGNWMSVIGIGYSALPPFRVFNPWTSTKKYDKECKYIKKWIPEIKDIPNEDILDWDIQYKNYNKYYEPIVDHSKRRIIYLKSI